MESGPSTILRMVPLALRALFESPVPGRIYPLSLRFQYRIGNPLARDADQSVAFDQQEVLRIVAARGHAGFAQHRGILRRELPAADMAGAAQSLSRVSAWNLTARFERSGGL